MKSGVFFRAVCFPNRLFGHAAFLFSPYPKNPWALHGKGSDPTPKRRGPGPQNPPSKPEMETPRPLQRIRAQEGSRLGTNPKDSMGLSYMPTLGWFGGSM